VLLAKERAAQLEALLARLSLAQADALRLRFFGGLKFQEIADTMQCSLNTAKNRVRDGLARMAEMLETAGAQRSDRRDEELRDL
jgi:RNA polymerase sigma-70 factor (ECF subfamily)